MAKKYLNKKEKEQVLIIASLKTYLDEAVETWDELDRPSDLLKYARMASSFAQKVLDIMLGDKDQDQVKAVIKENKKMEAVVKYTDKAKREYKEMEKLDELTYLETEEFYDIVELAIKECTRCEKTGEEAANCKQKKLFLKYDVPVLEEDPENCPYQY